MNNEEEQIEKVIEFKKKDIAEASYEIHKLEEREKILQIKLKFIIENDNDYELIDMYNTDIVESVSKRALLNQYVDETLESISVLNDRLNTYYRLYNTQIDVNTYTKEQNLDLEIKRKAEEMEV